MSEVMLNGPVGYFEWDDVSDWSYEIDKKLARGLKATDFSSHLDKRGFNLGLIYTGPDVDLHGSCSFGYEFFINSDLWNSIRHGHIRFQRRSATVLSIGDLNGQYRPSFRFEESMLIIELNWPRDIAVLNFCFKVRRMKPTRLTWTTAAMDICTKMVKGKYFNTCKDSRRVHWSHGIYQLDDVDVAHVGQDSQVVLRCGPVW